MANANNVQFKLFTSASFKFILLKYNPSNELLKISIRQQLYECLFQQIYILHFPFNDLFVYRVQGTGYYDPFLAAEFVFSPVKNREKKLLLMWKTIWGETSTLLRDMVTTELNPSPKHRTIFGLFIFKILKNASGNYYSIFHFTVNHLTVFGHTER